MRRGRLHVQAVCEVAGVSPEAVRNAARIMGYPVYGALIGVDPRKASLDFYRLVHEEHAALQSAVQRREAR